MRPAKVYLPRQAIVLSGVARLVRPQIDAALVSTPPAKLGNGSSGPSRRRLSGPNSLFGQGSWIGSGCGPRFDRRKQNCFRWVSPAVPRVFWASPEWLTTMRSMGVRCQEAVLLRWVDLKPSGPSPLCGNRRTSPLHACPTAPGRFGDCPPGTSGRRTRCASCTGHMPRPTRKMASACCGASIRRRGQAFVAIATTCTACSRMSLVTASATRHLGSRSAGTASPRSEPSSRCWPQCARGRHT
mmetsp:Transcript_3599/g.9215  ORF Transcript_3599/g.9215 Transcript_3599/m.9215 type:complete len:242 (+) Transcript_3599:266-991(+)